MTPARPAQMTRSASRTLMRHRHPISGTDMLDKFEPARHSDARVFKKANDGAESVLG